jgi:hypothetical protein
MRIQIFIKTEETVNELGRFYLFFCSFISRRQQDIFDI